MSRHIYIHRNAAQPPAQSPSVEIVSITNITSNGATILARIVSDGGSSITNYQFFASAPGRLTVQKTVSPNGDGTFGTTFSTLDANVLYKIEAYASNSAGAGSAQQNITTSTSVTVPIVQISGVSNILANSANVNFSIVSKGGGTVTVSGICWNTTGSPTTANSKTTDGPTELGAFTSLMSNLVAGTNYYVSAYATNQAGTAYSAATNFVTTNRVLILQFDTNCPATKVFDPSVVSNSGVYEWDLGDGTIVQGTSMNHTYANANIKTVKLFCKSGTPSISDISIIDKNVVGTMNLSHSAFATLQRIDIYRNSGLTGFQFPNIITGSVARLYCFDNGLTGTLDLRAFVNFTDSGSLFVTNASLTGVLFGATLTGKLSSLDIRESNLTGTVDLSPLTKWADSSALVITFNPNLTQITLGTVPTGTLRLLNVNTCSLDFINIASFALATRHVGFQWTFTNHGMTASEINRFLCDVDSITVASSSGTISILTSNAAPDSSSGGYNGTAAKASLISKGVNVY